MRNLYFSDKVRSEQNLYEDIVIESLQMYGQDVYYLPRDLVGEDKIFGQDVPSRFNSSHKIEMYIENVEGFDGDGDILSKFGVEIRDQATFMVAKKRWNQIKANSNSGVTSLRPNEGDLIYLPLSKSLFEIRFVEHEQPFYQLSNLPVYKMQCELYESNGESINTGITEIDDVVSTNAPQLAMVVGTGNGTEFTINETVRQVASDGSGAYVTGRVVAFEKPTADTRKLFISDWTTTDGEYHSFHTSTTITGLDSGAIWIPTNIYDVNDVPVTDSNNVTSDSSFPTDTQAQNQSFEYEADSIIDFSETNPFGDIGD